jgi:hypothetical protein
VISQFSFEIVGIMDKRMVAEGQLLVVIFEFSSQFGFGAPNF